MADRVIMPVALDSNGDIVSGAAAYFYERGTVTPRTVYSDENANTPHPSPVVASAAGVFPPVFTTAPLKIDIRDGLGASLPGYPSDPAYIMQADATGASSVTFTPITGNPAGNVQVAIQNLTTLWNAVTSYGKSLIAAVDAAAARAVLELKGGALADKSTTAQGEAGTDDTSWMTPATSKAAIEAMTYGYDVTYDDVTGSVTAGVARQNTTAFPIEVSASVGSPSGVRYIERSADGVAYHNVAVFGPTVGIIAIFILPPGHYYRIGSGSSITSITEAVKTV